MKTTILTPAAYRAFRKRLEAERAPYLIGAVTEVIEKPYRREIGEKEAE